MLGRRRLKITETGDIHDLGPERPPATLVPIPRLDDVAGPRDGANAERHDSAGDIVIVTGAKGDPIPD